MALQTKNRLKILIHQPRLSYYLGGGETVPLEQARILSVFGHTVEILTSRGPKFSTVFKDFCKQNPQIRIHFLKLPEKGQEVYKEEPGRRWFRWDVESILFGQRAIGFYSLNKRRWDLVITHLLSDSLFIPPDYINILHLHGVPAEKREIDNIFLKRPDRFIAVAKFVKRGWETLYPQLKKEKIKICYNGIDTKKFPNLKIYRDIDLLFVGRLLENKGIFIILEALKTLQREKVNFNKLIIIGDGPGKTHLEEMIKKMNLSQKVELIKSVPYKKLINFYNRAKIFLCPSYRKEGVLTTMLEAASCGAGIITANCCGMIEFAKNDYNVLLAQPASSKNLAKKIKLLLTNKKLRERISQKSEKDVKNNWDILKTGRGLEKIYLDFIKK